ncbi:hypothetical protein MTR67_036366 [Solanum verrucosum]|uniref:Reverse transcriptase domain-containing protein n=1 Tax=Solanum verrucosum TaxID=315347 RepID=A0AAF0UC50_SOLVR|nr:hypothetical protein MTR67_036366 [Solanum verrucosum]
MDAILMANELVDSRVRSNIPGILCKLDIQKAYDHLNWNFLLEAISKRGFGGRCIRWMKFCISTVNFSVLINGSPTGFFSSQRGLRQGDPLSPFLFIIAIESLNDMLKIAQENSWLKGFKASHKEAQTWRLPICRLHINWNKSFLYPVNEVPNLTLMAGVLGGSIGELPTVYLGMPLGDQNRSIDIWNGVVEKCEKRLVNWKNQYLSLGGRLTLINSVLDSMPTYMMSFFPIPDEVIVRLDVLRRNFLWEGNSKTKKFHLVKWDALIGSKQKGGMGVRNLKTQNQCLMMKWLWRFASSELALWKEVIQLKYEMADYWTTRMVTDSYGINLWRSIRNLWPKLRENSSIRTEDSKKVLFWEDKWITLQLWEMFLSKKGLNWVMPRKIDQTLKIWSSYANLSDHKDRWKIIPACIWWAAWTERNLRSIGKI